MSAPEAAATTAPTTVPLGSENENVILITYAAMILMAAIPIYIGSFRSMTSKISAETMTAKDAYMFPIIGSCVLFGLYTLFKLFSKEYINLLLTGYFLLFGVIAVTTTLIPWLRIAVPPAKDAKAHEFKMHFPWDKEETHIKFFAIDVFAAVIGVAVGAAYVLTKHWILSNILGLSFSISGITYLSLGSYKVGAILLLGLFVYDVFWVFGTDVMVTVAKSFDAPIKLLFPRDIFASEFKHAMLGLGDIVIPGIFVALLARFDKSQAGAAATAAKKAAPTSFATPYFNVTFVAYIAGLAFTMGIMHVFKAAQPALLYLVPACIGASLLLAVVRGELTPLFAYNEETPEEEQKQD